MTNFRLVKGMDVMAWMVERGSVLGRSGEQERVRVCWLHARTVTDQSREYFPRVLCRVQHHRFEQGPSRGYFLVFSSLWTAYADRDHGLCDGGEEYK